MKKRLLYISRQMLVSLIALQFLNLSVGSQTCWDDVYDYSYSYNKTFDPTETAVEWIVEMNYGQQPAFTYDNRTDTNKSLTRTFHWKTDIQQTHPGTFLVEAGKSKRMEIPHRPIQSPFGETLSPPPKPLSI